MAPRRRENRSIRPQKRPDWALLHREAIARRESAPEWRNKRVAKVVDADPPAFAFLQDGLHVCGDGLVVGDGIAEHRRAAKRENIVIFRVQRPWSLLRDETIALIGDVDVCALVGGLGDHCIWLIAEGPILDLPQQFLPLRIRHRRIDVAIPTVRIGQIVRPGPSLVNFQDAPAEQVDQDKEEQRVEEQNRGAGVPSHDFSWMRIRRRCCGFQGHRESEERIDKWPGSGSPENDENAHQKQDDDDREEPPLFVVHQEMHELAEHSGGSGVGVFFKLA